MHRKNSGCIRACGFKSQALSSLNPLFKNIAAFVTGHTNPAAASGCFLNLFAGRTFEVPVVLSVPVEKGPQGIVYISFIPVELGCHPGIISGKNSIYCKEH